MKTCLIFLAVLSFLPAVSFGQLAKPKLDGAPVPAEEFGEGWKILVQIANRTFSYGNDDEKVTVTVQILKDYADEASAKEGFVVDVKRYGRNGEKKQIAEFDAEFTSEFTRERYLVIGKFFVKFSQKKQENDMMSPFIEKYRDVLGKL